MEHRSPTSLFTVLALLAGCASSPPPAVQAPVAEPTPEAAPSEPEAEAETEPVAATPLRHLEIQRNVIRLRRGTRIEFATGSDQILPASNEVLDEVVSVMQQNGRIRIRVEGHTDDVGADADNMELSTRRATSVQNYLTQHGIPAERVESTGCGEGVPLAANDSDENRQQNRRVEFVVLRRRRVIERCQVYRPRDASAAATATP